MKESAKQAVERLGREVLQSDIFKKSFSQVHHGRTTVGEHSLSVAENAYEICLFLRARGVEIDEETVVRAALCHDLGLVGRFEKYHSAYETSRMHPIDSVRIAEELFVSENTVRTHSKRIYAKLDIHKKQELRDLVDTYDPSAIR